MFNASMLTPPRVHHDGSELYVSTIVPKIGDEVTLSIRVDHSLAVDEVFVRVIFDGDPHFIRAELQSESDNETWWSAMITQTNHRVNYRFALQSADRTYWFNGLGLHDRDVSDAHDFLLTTYSVPAWVDDAIFYQIFPDRFARSINHVATSSPEWAIPATWETPVAAETPAGVKQWYGGSLWGIAEHIDYLADLGVNALYLTPFFPANSNHRYDASSFDTVDPFLGGDEALRSLIETAHQAGIRVVGDLTLNHSGNEHPWFIEAQIQPDSPKSDFYLFTSADRQSYVSFADVPSLPKFDHRSHALQKKLYNGPESVISRYISDFDLDGWRIDVAQAAGRYHETDLSREIAQKTRQTMAEFGTDRLLLAEHQFDASADLQGDGWHGTMAYAGFTKPIWGWLGKNIERDQWGAPLPSPRLNGTQLAETMTEFSSLIPWKNVLANMNLLDSHDSSRFRSVAGDFQPLGIALLLTLPGMPMIFSGDEIGIDGVGMEASRKPFLWNEAEWDHDIYGLYKALIRLRRTHSALRSGGLRWFATGDDYVIFERSNREETLLIEVSRASHEPLVSSVNGSSLLDGVNLTAGKLMPELSCGFNIWKVE
ncbi:glycoside hydrolase family 13 protein [Arcanobacterium phocae]|uniref:glycoside hydrolase family 13 protein n=1 Tax=Arcanobacterium phocae TaxID=131112 RepID=UPI001C0EE88D|nr:glycoside hydrolase family 13 protein [Arcanobacterium phocae]